MTAAVRLSKRVTVVGTRVPLATRLGAIMFGTFTRNVTISVPITRRHRNRFGRRFEPQSRAESVRSIVRDYRCLRTGVAQTFVVYFRLSSCNWLISPDMWRSVAASIIFLSPTAQFPAADRELNRYDSRYQQVRNRSTQTGVSEGAIVSAVVSLQTANRSQRTSLERNHSPILPVSLN